MTLIVGVLNGDYAVQVSDRRLSSQGRPVDEESNKAVVLACANARFLVGFTGLAEAGSFRTREWLVDALLDVGPPDFSAGGIGQRFVRRATEDFRSLPQLRLLDASQKRLTVMLTGFLATDSGPWGVALLVSNYQDFEMRRDYLTAGEFRAFPYQAKRGLPEPPTWVERVGAVAG